MFNRQIGCKLSNIQYSISEAKDDYRVWDEYAIESVEPQKIFFDYVRKLKYSTGVQTYNLSITVKVTRTAEDAEMDLTEHFDEQYLKENIDMILGATPNYVSLLISQITSSFNRVPIITPPTFIEKELD